jgi:hypothetical protein
MDRTAVTVWIGDRRYEVNLDTEVVHAWVHRKFTWRLVKCTSKRIETAAILKASDAFHRTEDD